MITLFEEQESAITHEVGLKLPNPWGIYDMHGNVSGWCFDWYQDSYDRGNQIDPNGPESGQVRVLRGGSWLHDVEMCRSSYRLMNFPKTSLDSIGFRVALSLTKEKTQENSRFSSYDETVFQAQKRLTVLGYDPGPIDGIWGKKTENTLKKFQQDNGLTVTKKLDPATCQKLDIISIPSSQLSSNVEENSELPKTSAGWIKSAVGGGDSVIVIPLSNLPADAKSLEMVLIPAGRFTMGSPSSEKDRDSDEGPQHQVTITKSFYLGKYEWLLNKICG